MSYTINKEAITISDDIERLSIGLIHSYLSNESYWAKGIPYATVERSIKHSLCFGLYHHQQQIGFARVITDRTTFAYLADVFIIEAYRKQGLSKWLVQTIHAHPELQGLRRWMLGTRDAHGLYQQFGWKPLNEPSRFMEVAIPNIYTTNKSTQ